VREKICRERRTKRKRVDVVREVRENLWQAGERGEVERERRRMVAGENETQESI